MNYNKEIKFVDVEDVRNPETLNYEAVINVQHTMNAVVYKIGSAEELRSFGNVTNERVVCIILGTYTSPFKYIYHEGDYYKVLNIQEIKSKTAFTLEKIGEHFGDVYE